ncbi:MAG: hypothetical protein ACR2JY_00955 [Chloroflexota bacterium]
MGTASWYLEERARAGGEHLDAEYVADYDQKAATDPSDDLAVFQGSGPQATRTLVGHAAFSGEMG